MINSRCYHEEELRIAQSSQDPRRLLPPPLAPGKTVLDIGCGAGQTLIAAYPDRLSFGIDIDMNALELGRRWTDRVAFTRGSAEALPYVDGVFDAVIARVSLPYTDLRRSLPEVYRGLKPGGLLWMTLHEFSVPWNQAKRSSLKGWIFFAYTVTNSLLFHCCGRVFRLPGKHYESFQTDGGITRALRRAGFAEITIHRQSPPLFLVTAVKPR